jgi:hypothetical protein
MGKGKVAPAPVISAARAEPIAKETMAVIARVFTKLRLVFTWVLKWLTTTSLYGVGMTVI